MGLLLITTMLVWRARAALFPFALGAVLAYVLTPIVDRIATVLPAHSQRGDIYRRGAAVLVVYAVIGSILFAAGLMIIPVATDQVAQFTETLPALVDDSRAQVEEWLSEYRERVPADAQARIDSYADDASAALANMLEDTVRRSAGIVTSTVAVVFGFLIVPFWMFYAMRDRHKVGRNLISAVPAEARNDVQNLLTIGDRILGRYLRGQLILGVVVGVAVGVALTLMDVELSLALGVFAGITELIPIIGPWIGAIPALMIVAATDPGLMIWVALLYLGVQQVENNLLVPRIQGHAVDIHPAMIILLLVVAGAVFGFWGLVVIVPLTAILRALFWYADHRLSGATPAEALTGTGASAPSPPATRPAPAEAPIEGPAPSATEHAVSSPEAGEEG